jgi:DNA-binding transcriptional regulator YiaG
MSTLAAALKDEIRRIARKEIRSETQSIAQAVTRFRGDIAALKRRLSECEKKIAYLEAQERKRITKTRVSEESNDGVRFSARSVKAQRTKSGLSAANYAKLVGVSPLTIYSWEQGKTKPRQKQLASLVALRGIGKREAQAKIELLHGHKPRARNARSKKA